MIGEPSTECLGAPLVMRLVRAGLRALASVTVGVVFAACAGRSAPAGARIEPTVAAAGAPSVQRLYESGRHAEVVTRVSVAPAGAVTSEDVWLAGHSHLRLGQPGLAAQDFERLSAMSGSAAWRATSRLALSGIDGTTADDQVQSAANDFPDDFFAQYEIGLAQARRRDFAAAAEAFERAIALNPGFAYAHYQAGLVHNRLGRADRMANRFESFLRLAPNAPERPEVETILQTLRRP
jgi:tetratricopeptide (TPR) repeat protein